MAGEKPKTVTHRSRPCTAGEADCGVRWANEAGVVAWWAGEGEGERSERIDGGPVSRSDLFGGIRDGVRIEPAGLGSSPTAEPRRALVEKWLSGVTRAREAAGASRLAAEAESGVRRRSLKATVCPWRRRWKVHGGVAMSAAGGLPADRGAGSRAGVRDGVKGKEADGARAGVEEEERRKLGSRSAEGGSAEWPGSFEEGDSMVWRGRASLERGRGVGGVERDDGGVARPMGKGDRGREGDGRRAGEAGGAGECGSGTAAMGRARSAGDREQGREGKRGGAGKERCRRGRGGAQNCTYGRRLRAKGAQRCVHQWRCNGGETASRRCGPA